MGVVDMSPEAGRTLISAAYQAQRGELHTDPKYGVMPMLYAPMVSLAINHMGKEDHQGFWAALLPKASLHSETAT